MRFNDALTRRTSRFEENAGQLRRSALLGFDRTVDLVGLPELNLEGLGATAEPRIPVPLVVLERDPAAVRRNVFRSYYLGREFAGAQAAGLLRSSGRCESRVWRRAFGTNHAALRGPAGHRFDQAHQPIDLSAERLNLCVDVGGFAAA